MNSLRALWMLLLLLLAGNAMAGQQVGQYFVGDQWTGSNEASLPHYRSPGEGCVGVMLTDLRSEQQSHPGNPMRFRLLQVGQDDGSFAFGCGGEVDEFGAGVWTPLITYDVDNEYVYGFTPSVTCVLTGLLDPDTGQCGPPKCCMTAMGDPIDAGTGNKHQMETDYVGAGAFPLHFERTYDSSRTWLNNPVPIGIGWTHTYLASIHFMQAAGSVTITQAVAYRPNGTILRFNLVGGVWTPDNDVPERLSATIDSNGIPSATLTNPDDSVEKYDGIGRLTSITNRGGLTQTLSYITPAGAYANDVQKVTDPQGRTLSFGYNTNGQLASLTDGAGIVTQYTYDGNGNLASVVYPDTGSTTKTRNYLYNEAEQVAVSWPNALTGISEEITTGTFQRFASWDYDSDGRAILSVHGPHDTGTIGKTTLAFNSSGTTTFTSTVSASLGLSQARTYSFTVDYQVAHPASLDMPCDGCSAHDQTDGYDANGYPNVSTDFDNNSSTYVFSGNTTSGVPGGGLETQRVEGIPPSSSSDTSARRIVNTTWNPSFRVPASRIVQDDSGTTPVTVEITRWIYNSRGQPTFRCLIDPTNGTATSYTCGSQASAPVGVRQWAWTYCDAVGTGCPLIGLVLTGKGPRTDVNELTTYAYYASDDSTCATAPTTCPHRKGDLQTVTDALAHVTTYVSYDGDGRPTRITDPNAVPTDLSYHPRGWLTQRAVRYASSGTSANDRITTWAYDGAGEVTRVTQPMGDYQIFGYDLAHRLTDVTNRMNEHLHYVLDDAGDRQEEDSYNPSGTLKHKVLRDYSALGRLQDEKNANTAQTPLAMSYQYDPDGNIQQTADGRKPSHITIDTYDPRNRLVKVDRDSGATDEATTHYAYDALDRLTDVQDPFSLHTTYTFDGLGNQTKLSSPGTGLTTYGHDAAGNRTSRMDARNVASSYAYDALNRMTAITYPATPSLNMGYIWDTVATGCVSPNRIAKGRLSTVTDASGSTTFCYDRFGDTAMKTQTIGGSAFPVSYAWNRDARLNSVTEPDNTTVTYTRDNNNRIDAASYKLNGQSSATTLISAVAYNPFGPVNKITYGSGTTARPLSRTYDLDGVVQTVVDSSTVGDGLNLTFGRDAVGNLTTVKTSPTVGSRLVYDGLDRLTQMSTTDLSTNPLWRYTYDGTGNRMSIQSGTTVAVPYTYQLNTHQLHAVGSTLRSYDADGNTTTIGSTLGFVYDGTGRMDEVDVGGAQARLYATNALGQRVMKSKTGDATKTLKTVYDEAGHMLGDFNATNAIVDEYLWMDDLPVGVVDGASGTLKYIEPDHLGTPRTAIDPATNQAIWNWPVLSEPFGQAQPVNLHGSSFVLNLRFPGQVYDAESGMNYNYSRDYDPGTGRYIESDPIGLSGGISTYAYANSFPLSASDFFGLGARKTADGSRF